MEKTIITSPNAPAPIGPYNQAVRFGNFLFISGQIPSDAASGVLIVDNILAATELVMRNLEAILIASGLTFEHVLKTTIFITDMSLFAQVNEVYGRYVRHETAPARETVQVAGLPRGVQVEISMIAGY